MPKITDKPGTSTQNIYWDVGPSYNRGEIHFGFGPLRPVIESGKETGRELLLYALTPDEAREIAAVLVDWAMYAEKGGD